MRTSACAQAINEGIIPGPRMLVAGPAMVVTGSYAPKGFAPEVTVPQGAEEADGLDGVVRVARGQIAHGVDLIKIYADYRWGPNGETRPGFTLEEIQRIVAGGQQQRPSGRRAFVDARRHAATRSWAASTPSSTATKARRRSGS